MHPFILIAMEEIKFTTTSSITFVVTPLIIKEGVILYQCTDKKKIQWVVIEVIDHKFYATDNDGFGSLFDFSELNNEWIYYNKTQ